jgi:hypothetical protein
VSPSIQQRHEGLPKAIIDRAWDAQLRLCKRFRKLTARGKPHNVALVAVARELAGFIWDIARMSTAAPPSIADSRTSQSLKEIESAVGGAAPVRCATRHGVTRRTCSDSRF